MLAKNTNHPTPSMKSLTVACLLTLLTTATTASAEPPQYQVVQFELVEGKYPFTADKISNNGMIIGRYSTNDGSFHGYRPAVLSNGVYHTLPDGFQTARILMTAINDHGIIVGWEEASIPMGQGFATNGKKVVHLGTLGGGYSYAFGLNNTGTIVGNSITDDPDGSPGNAFIWSKGVMTELPPLSDDIGYSYGIAVNDDNNTVGFSWDDQRNSRAVLWLADGSGPVVLTEGVDRGFPETAVDINDSNQIIGDAAIDDPESIVHAFFWENGVMTDIGILPEAGRQGPYGPELMQTRAIAINDLGQVVGNSQPHFPDPDFDTRPGPFFWENGEIFNLNDYLVPANADDETARQPRAAMQILYVGDIANDGTILATSSTNDPFRGRSVMLVPVK